MRIYCPECKFWSSQKPNQGLCRINSPVTYEDSVYGRWPVTRADDWCGEGEPVDSSDEEVGRKEGMTKAGLVALRLLKDKDSV